MEKLQKNQIHRLTIEGYASEGQGVARLNGQVVFVQGALKGEVCDVLLLKVGKTALWGKAVKVIEPSPRRIPSDCPYYPVCGGCRTRHMSYEEELEFKRSRVEEALHRIGGTNVPVSVIYGAKNTERYRNKAQFPLAPGETGPNIGFYRARSHQVLDVGDCLLQSRATGRLRAALLDWMKKYQVAAYDEAAHQGLVRHLLVRTNEAGQSLCGVVVNGNKLPHEAELIDALRQAEPGLAGVVLAENRQQTNVILGERFRTLWGQSYLEETLCGFQFRLSVPSFFQVNRAQAEVLYNLAVELAEFQGNERVLDLYCGVGTITLVMAAHAKEAIGAEVVPQAVEDAKENAVRNGVSNVRFLCADAGQAAQALAQEGVRPDVICVDPPRKGLDETVIEAIAQMKPQKLIYVSCDPGTLARDVKRLGERDYVLQKAIAVDLFPRTHHVECLVLMSRVKE